MNATTTTQARYIRRGDQIIDDEQLLEVVSVSYRQPIIVFTFDDGSYRSLRPSHKVQVITSALAPFVGDPFAGLV